MCVLTVPPTSCFTVSVSLLGHSFSLRHKIEIKPINNPTMGSKCSSERKSHVFLTLNQKPEIIQLSEGGMLKAKIGQKPSCECKKEKFLKQIRSATTVNTRMTDKKAKRPLLLIRKKF